jgi:hypothetical protein
MDRIALLEEQFREVGTVLASDPGDEGSLSHQISFEAADYPRSAL